MRGGGGGGPWSGHAVSEDEKLDRREAQQVLRRAFRMLRPYRREVVIAVLVMVGFTAATVGGPAIVRYGIDNGLRPGHQHPGALNRAAIGYACVALVSLWLARTQILLVTRVGEKFLRDLRRRVFNHILGMSMSFFDSEQTGRLVARMTSDIDSLQELIQQGLVAFATNLLLLLFTITLMLLLSPIMSAICLIALPIVIVASIKFQRSSNRAYLKVRDRIGQTLSTFQEGISGVRVIQAFGREDMQVRRFSKANTAQLDANVHAVKISALYFPVVELAGIATTASIIGIGGALYHGGYVTLGTIIAFVLLLANLFEPVQQLSQLFNMVQSSAAALAKLFGLLDITSPLAERPGAVDLPMTGALEARDVAFTYDGSKYVLRRVSLTVEPGERLALVGPTGAGKSTLAKLLARLYDPNEGTIKYGGVDLRDSTLSSLRERIVVVPQEGYLFQGTIRDNVRIGRPAATDAEVAEALHLIGAYDRFAALAEGLETEVRERGSRLSAGERQLVSLARAALANPQVLVLDEATSNLDPGTEADVELAMTALMEGRTSLVIAHRLSTAERADRVAVVDAGGLLELGTHSELVDQGGRYAALYQSWVGEGHGQVA
ncbi:MAG: ABC transporter ATP-binding protein [Actinobacteria bacterium]|nr:ABC transporter ATP-binding protein [Actinomycetota bacterium]